MDEATLVADLSSAELLGHLPRELLQELASQARERTFVDGEVLFRKGDEGHSLHVVRDGEVDIVLTQAGTTNDDETKVLARCGRGKLFGELAVFDPAPRSAGAVAVGPTTTLELDRDDVMRILAARPEVAALLLGQAARSLTQAKEQVTLHNLFLDEKVRERTAEVRDTQLEVLRRLGVAAEYRDEQTGQHIYRMSNYAGALATAAGMGPIDLERLLNAAPMHDIGKIGVPDAVLLKPGKLEAAEWDIMRAHTIMGAGMLAGSRSDVIQLAQKIALEHHERWDGRGYPHNKKGEEILFQARICCVADVFDALTSERPYKDAWTFDDALAEIELQSGQMFDPELAKLFTALEPDLRRIRADAANQPEAL